MHNNAPYNPDHLSRPQLWALALSGILSEMNRVRHDQLQGSGQLPPDKADIRHALKLYWNIQSQEDLLSNLYWLRQEGGHNQGFMRWMRIFAVKSMQRIEAYQMAHPDNAVVELVALYQRTLADVGIRAWDDGRYVSLCRWGVTAGYLTENEAWQRLLPLAENVQQCFTGWSQFAISYIAGKQFWQEMTSVEFLDKEMAHVTRLMTHPDSSWVRLPWTQDLSV